MDTNERFTRCWTEAQPVVACFIGALVPDFRDAEDLLQNVAVTCLRKFEEYDPQRPFTAWAMGIARFEVLRLRRSQSRNRLLLNEDLVAQVATACDDVAPEIERRRSALRDCLGSVPGHARRLLRLRYEEALAPADLSELVRMAPGAVRTALSRTRASLRKCIEHRLKSGEVFP